METVTVTRHIDAPRSAVEALVADVEVFMAAGGFDEVELVDDRTLRIARHLGLGRIELHLDLLDDPEADLAYRQREGIFEAMTTRYSLEAAGGGVEVSATTEFAVGGLVGRVLDATVIKRQRRRELEAQFDYLESAVGGD